ncbi:MAG: GGDEF domain-containing protein, partial [Treponema sp.]|nr:GGDEF domain-containing protein [Treponema sp.]
VYNAGKLEEERNNYYDQSTIDELTGLKNRRDFMQTFQRRLSSYRSTDDWLCIAIMDIDFFKNYNDHYGHLKGDECLRSIGRALNSLRDKGVYAARVGGEEFALIWYENDTMHIDETASLIRQKINELNIPHEKSKAASNITISVGIHTIRCGASNDGQSLYDNADKALYEAKRGGRNRTVIYEHDKLQKAVGDSA